MFLLGGALTGRHVKYNDVLGVLAHYIQTHVRHHCELGRLAIFEGHPDPRAGWNRDVPFSRSLALSLSLSLSLSV